MSCQYSKKFGCILLFFSVFQFVSTDLHAQNTLNENNKNFFESGFYGGFEIGTGWLELSRNNQTEGPKSRFIFGLYGGYSPFRALRVGIKLDGYLIESFGSSNPEKGISISNNHLQLQVFPFKKNGLFTNFQGGWSRYTNRHPLERYAKGTSAKIGLGYEYTINEDLGLSLVTNYGFGKFNDVSDVMVTVLNQHYNSWDITFCLTYR